MRALRGGLNALREARTGSVTILFAVSLTTLCMALGLAIDFSMSHSAHSKLQSAADAAALGVVAAAARSDGGQIALAAAKEHGRFIYMERLSAEPAELKPVPKVELRQIDGRYESTVSYTLERATMFGAFFDRPTTLIAGTATASQQSSYMDVHLVLDVSASMGLGATEDDQRRLYQQVGCQFGCHVAESGTPTEQQAIDLGIPMRIDVLKTATRRLVDEMAAHRASNAFRIALHTFHETAEQLIAPTRSFSTASSAVQALRLAMGRPRAGTQPGTGNTPDTGDTQPVAMVSYLGQALGSQGTGRIDDPRKYVVIVTDGTESTWSPGITSRPWDPAVCRSLHDEGINVAVIYLQYDYYGKETDGTWQSVISPIYDQIEPNLRACANGGLFISANDPDEIVTAFSRVFDDIASRATTRLTN